MKTVDDRVEEIKEWWISNNIGIQELLAEFRRHLTAAEYNARHKEREWAIICVRRYHADMVQKLAKGEEP